MNRCRRRERYQRRRSRDCSRSRIGSWLVCWVSGAEEIGLVEGLAGAVAGGCAGCVGCGAGDGFGTAARDGDGGEEGAGWR